MPLTLQLQPHSRLGVVEPWMSGLAAGGCMVLWRADEKKSYGIDFGMRSPRSLNPKDYPLSGNGKSSRLISLGTCR
jgi:gamma-glutamyltranspeptidase/glutathione hydrolase